MALGYLLILSVFILVLSILGISLLFFLKKQQTKKCSILFFSYMVNSYSIS